MQDLEFPAACHRLKPTPDGQYLFATGIHAPRLRVYELSQLSMKFERHFDAEIVDFQVLFFVTCSVYSSVHVDWHMHTKWQAAFVCNASWCCISSQVPYACSAFTYLVYT